jgi:hypothetical protein
MGRVTRPIPLCLDHLQPRHGLDRSSRDASIARADDSGICAGQHVRELPGGADCLVTITGMERRQVTIWVAVRTFLVTAGLLPRRPRRRVDGHGRDQLVVAWLTAEDLEHLGEALDATHHPKLGYRWRRRRSSGRW